MLGGMLTKDRKPPDGFSDWDSFYEHGAREILPKLERALSHVWDVVNTGVPVFLRDALENK